MAEPIRGTMEDLCTIANTLGISYGKDAPPQEGFTWSNGVRLHWVDWGHADKPPLIFLHGAALSARTWDLVCLNLRTDYHCVALDQRGHGLSEGLFSFGVEEPKADLRGVVEALGLERPVFIGMSMGGNNIVAYAGSYADDMAGAVFIDICPRVLPGSYEYAVARDAIIARSRSLDEAAEIAHCLNPRGSKAYKRYTLSYALERFPDGFWRFRYERDKALPKTAEENARYMMWRRQCLWSYVSLIQCPSLVVHGTESIPQSFESLNEFREKLPAGSLVQIAGAGHDVQEDQPKSLARAVRVFLTHVGYQ